VTQRETMDGQERFSLCPVQPTGAGLTLKYNSEMVIRKKDRAGW